MAEEVDYRKEQSLIEQRLRELETRRKQVCLGRANIAGLILVAGDIVKLKVKGFTREEFEAVFVCFNPAYNWLRIDLGDSEMIVKLSDIRFIRKEKTKREVEKGG